MVTSLRSVSLGELHVDTLRGLGEGRVVRPLLASKPLVLHAQSKSAGPKFSWGQAVARLGRPHCQDISDGGTGKKLLTVGPPQCTAVATAWPHKSFGPADSL